MDIRTLFVVALACAGCGGSSTPTTTTPAGSSTSPENVVATESGVSPAVQAAVGATDRAEDDRALDPGRHPAEVLSFFRIEPGQRVAEIFAGGGYTSELLARVVGASGKVFAQNTTLILDRFARAPLNARLARLGNPPHIVAVERELGDPLPPEATGLDAVVSVLVYHDTVWAQADRAAMNRAIFNALRPGGVYGIVDHSAAAGHGANDTETLHRIEESVVIEEVQAAGFRLDGTSDVLRNPDDTRDWNASPRSAAERRGTSDRFVLRFVRP